MQYFLFLYREYIRISGYTNYTSVELYLKKFNQAFRDTLMCVMNGKNIKNNK